MIKHLKHKHCMNIKTYTRYAFVAFCCIIQNKTLASELKRQAACVLITNEDAEVLVAEENTNPGIVAFLGFNYKQENYSDTLILQSLKHKYGIQLKNNRNIRLIGSQKSETASVNSVYSNQGVFLYSIPAENITRISQTNNNAIKKLTFFPIDSLIKKESHNNLTPNEDHARIAKLFLQKSS